LILNYRDAVATHFCKGLTTIAMACVKYLSKNFIKSDYICSKIPILLGSSLWSKLQYLQYRH